METKQQIFRQVANDNPKEREGLVAFMRTFSKLDVNRKLATSKKFAARAATAEPRLQPTIKAMEAWMGMSIMVGEELCPPTIEHLETYIY